jgi:hypothetical protein
MLRLKLEHFEWSTSENARGDTYLNESKRQAIAEITVDDTEAVKLQDLLEILLSPRTMLAYDSETKEFHRVPK